MSSLLFSKEDGCADAALWLRTMRASLGLLG